MLHRRRLQPVSESEGTDASRLVSRSVRSSKTRLRQLAKAHLSRRARGPMQPLKERVRPRGSSDCQKEGCGVHVHPRARAGVVDMLVILCVVWVGVRGGVPRKACTRAVGRGSVLHHRLGRDAGSGGRKGVGGRDGGGGPVVVPPLGVELQWGCRQGPCQRLTLLLTRVSGSSLRHVWLFALNISVGSWCYLLPGSASSWAAVQKTTRITRTGLSLRSDLNKIMGMSSIIVR